MNVEQTIRELDEIARADGWPAGSQAARLIESLARQLQAVDDALGPWESEPYSHAGAVGRVQTIRNLKIDREKLRELATTCCMTGGRT